MVDAASSRELRVLMLEDSPTDAELMQHELRKSGMSFTALRVDTREEFIRALEEFRPDVILSDYKLPAFDGKAALKIERHEHPEIPVVMVTGALPDIEAVDLITAGAKDYVLKDRLARLAPAVRRVLSAEQGIRARKAAEKELHRLNRALRALSAGNHALIHADNEQVLLETMCQAVTDVGYALAWVGYAEQDKNKSVVPMAIAGEGKGFVELLQRSWDDVPLGRGPTGTAIRTGQTQIVTDIGKYPGMEPWREAAVQYGYASGISLPLKGTSEVIGALTIYAVESAAFGADQVALLEEMASDLAFGIMNLRTRIERDKAIKERQHYVERLHASLEQALEAISTLVEMRDPYTAGHQRLVAKLAVAIAREMKMPEGRIHGLHLAGIVHDLGKISIPVEILAKPGVLTDMELSLIRTHPQAGYEALKGIEFPWPIAEMVLQHHERLDGSGYPMGLKNGDILLEAKILAVADVVVSIETHRPYRASLGLEAALQEITDNRGKLYDSKVVDACVRLFMEKEYTLSH